MDDTAIADFFRRHQATVTSAGPRMPNIPVLPIDSDVEEEGEENVNRIFRDVEIVEQKWEPLIVMEAPAKAGEFPIRFIDGSQRHQTVLWLRSPVGSLIPLLVAEVGAVSLRLEGRRFNREAVEIERIVSFVADPFPWEEIENLSLALSRKVASNPDNVEGNPNALGEFPMRLTLANQPMEEYHPFDYEIMRKQAVRRINQEMMTWERLLLLRNTTLPTLVDGPLHRVMGEPPADGPLIVGVAKIPAANYLHLQGWRTLTELKPGQRTPVFKIIGEGQGKQGRFPVATWYLKLAGGPRFAPNWGHVRVEIPWNQFETRFQNDFHFIGRLSRWLMDARCRQESYSRMPVSLEPILRAEEVIKPLFTPLNLLSYRLCHHAGLLRSTESN